MNKFLKSPFIFLLWSCLVSQAQTTDILPSTDYRLISAYSGIAGCCLLENRNGEGATDFIYAYSEKDDTDERQIWQFTKDTDDTTLVYIRNKNTHRYLSGEVDARGNLFKVLPQATKTEAKPWTVTEITGGQLLFSCVNAYGVRYYLHATDTIYAASYYPSFKATAKANKNTRFAWTLEQIVETPEGIRSLPQNSHEVKVSVLDRHIIVANDDDYQIFNLQGRQLGRDGSLQPGIYLVRTSQKTFKVTVK